MKGAAVIRSPMGWAEVFDPSRADADSVVPYLAISHALASSARIIVDVGCGRGWSADGGGTSFHDLRSHGRRVIGIDVDDAASVNPMIDEFRLIGSDGRWPLDDEQADLVVSDFTLEHLVDPSTFVEELIRVLRPGGAFVARSVSRYSPLSFIARLVPNARHTRMLRHVQPGRQSRDVFPTMYRMNSDRQILGLLGERFDCAVAHRSGLARYLLRWPRLAKVADAVEPRLPKALRTTIVVTARKRPYGAGTPHSYG